MKIACVAKGGSGKSTVTALLTRYLEEKKKHWLCIDADINMHMSGLLGVSLTRDKALSREDNEVQIKKYIHGKNSKIVDSSQIVKTTPPTRDSGLVYIRPEHEILRAYATLVRTYGHLMQVGTYEEAGIGESCYHTNLAVCEALISHTITDENHILVADMTAGTDAFAGSLHASFDLICLVVEPTNESVSLAKEYLLLAEKGNVLKHVGIIGNKIEDETDVVYIEKELGVKILMTVPLLKKLKALRRDNKTIFELDQEEFEAISFTAILDRARDNMVHADERLRLLFDLHKKHVAADYIVNRHGDLTGQIDATFSYKNQTYGE